MKTLGYFFAGIVVAGIAYMIEEVASAEAAWTYAVIVMLAILVTRPQFVEQLLSDIGVRG